MSDFVMFGQSGLFGDYADIVHALGGVLKKVVLNVPDPVHPRRPTFQERVDRYNAQLEDRGVRRPAVLEPLEHFEPEAHETYLIGFRGEQLLPLRDRLVERFGLRFDPIVHPRAIVSPTARLSEGAIVNAGAVIGANVTLGRYTLVNRGATIGHDGCLDEFANVGPGADIASNVQLGRCAVVGVGATLIEDLRVGEGAYVAAGAVVLRDVPPRTLVAGVPSVEKKKLG